MAIRASRNCYLVLGFGNEQVRGFLPPITLQEIQAAEVKTDAASLPM